MVPLVGLGLGNRLLRRAQSQGVGWDMQAAVVNEPEAAVFTFDTLEFGFVGQQAMYVKVGIAFPGGSLLMKYL